LFYFLSYLELYSADVKKGYLVDNYFSTQFGSTQSENLGHLMEPSVHNYLHIR
jgi:hypothetical protein